MRPRLRFSAVATALLLATSLADAETFPVHITIDAAKPSGPLKPIWRFFGADEPNYAYMKHGTELLGELGELKKDEVFFRAHNLLVTGKGTHGLKWGSTNAYTEDAAGNPVYDWTIVDRIFDAYRSNGVRPYVQIGFMPQALSVKPEPYRHHWNPKDKYFDIVAGWAYPPKDYAKWEELVYQWAKHCVEKYGEDEVHHWYWQTWNEPNIRYWQGTRDEFFKLHDHAVRAVRRAIPGAKVGGPDIAGGKGGDFLEGFLRHCIDGPNKATGGKGTPLDFISFHAKGWPEQVDGQRLKVVSDGARPLEEMLKSGVRGKPDVSALSARKGNRVTALVWHYHDDDVPGPEAEVTLDLTKTPPDSPRTTRTLIDESHSNSFNAWLAMGSPQSPTPDQLRELEDASRLAAADAPPVLETSDDSCRVIFSLARKGVTLLELEWPAP